MNKEQFQEYAHIKNQIKDLTAEAKELEPQLREAMVEAGADKVKTEFGSFIITNRKSWTYSDAVKEAEAKVKELKAKEEANGTAKAEEKESLMFK